MAASRTFLLAGLAGLAGLLILLTLLFRPGGGESDLRETSTTSPRTGSTSSGPESSPPPDPSGPGGPDRGVERPDDFVPPEVLAAAAGRRPLPEPGQRPPFPVELEIGPPGGAPGGGPGGLGRGPGGPGLPGGGAGGDPDDDGDRQERERRQVWIARQKSRNRVRADFLVEEHGLDEARAVRFVEILDQSVDSKVAFYETIDPDQVDPSVLGAGLDRIREREQNALRDLLGPRLLATYREADDAGHFVLPEEKQKPPR